MALNTEIWIKDVQDNIKLNADFLSAVTDHSAYITNRVVHVPQAGSVVGIAVDRTVLPAAVVQRTDTELVYQIKQYTTTPVLVTNLDEFQLSYDKRRSVMGESLDFLTERMGNEALFTYATGTPIISTTGPSAADALAPSATGTRKQVSVADIANLAKKLDKDGMPKKGRVLIMQTDMFYQLFTISDIVKASYNGFQNNVLETGVVAQLFGFDIMVRPYVAVYAGTTAKAAEAAGAAGDHLGCIAFHKSVLAKALNTPMAMYNENDPTYFGSILSLIQWAGFSKLRSDNKGVVALVQAV